MTQTDKIKLIRKDFNKLSSNLGEIKDKGSVPFSFTYTGTTPIEALEKTCGCTADLKYDPKTNLITGTLNLNENPSNQVKEEKFQDFSKIIRVYFEPNVPTHVVNNYIRSSNTNKIIINLTLKGMVEFP